MAVARASHEVTAVEMSTTTAIGPVDNPFEDHVKTTALSRRATPILLLSTFAIGISLGIGAGVGIGAAAWSSSDSSSTSTPSVTPSISDSVSRQLYEEALHGRVAELLALFEGSAQRDLLVSQLDADSGRTTGALPVSSFCADLAWCAGRGVPQCDMTYGQKAAMHAVLNAALSEGGYQTVVSVVNQQRDIGELEHMGGGEASLSLVSQMWQRMIETNASMDMGSNASVSFWELADSLGVDLSNVSYMATAGKRPDSKASALPHAGANRLVDGSSISWDWSLPPGFLARLGQFCGYSLALYLEDPRSFRDGDAFAIRFQGHHVDINILVQHDRNGEVHVQNTPLMVGSFPAQAPPFYLQQANDAAGDAGSGAAPCGTRGAAPCGGAEFVEWGEWAYMAQWTEGQLHLWHGVTHFRGFVAALPPAVYAQSRFNGSLLGQHPFAAHGIPNEYQLLAGFERNLTAQRLEEALAGFSRADVAVSSLSAQAQWELLRGMRFFTSLMAPEVAAVYYGRVEAAMGQPGATLTVISDGSPPETPGGAFYFFVVIADLLIEMTISVEWSSVVRPAPAGDEHEGSIPFNNHVHAILRDLRNPWARDPLADHLTAEHSHDLSPGHDH